MIGPVLSNLHLLRPDWLWALLLLPALAAVWSLRRRRGVVWRDIVDPHLLPHLLDHRAVPRQRWLREQGLRVLGLLAGVLAYALAVLALAGPSWRQVEQPLWQSRAPLVVALDLSSAMLAADPPPSRMAQARAKLAALLASREDGPVGLLVFADDAFTVAPITDDTGNVALFLDALAPDIMPVDGQRADRAVEAAVQLMRQAGFENGQVLLMTDGAGDRAIEAARVAHAGGFEVAVLGLGRSGGIAYRGVDGRTANARFDEAALRRLASAGGGRYARLAVDGSDLQGLGVLDGGIAGAAGTGSKAGSAWLDEGFWLLPPLMLLVLLAFRRGAALSALLIVLCLPIAPAGAAELWRRADQVEHRRMGEAAEAYRRGDYAAAEQGYSGIDSADGHYNRGNALAKAGEYEQALDAYDHALELQPGMEDAIANRAAVEAAMRRQPQQGDGQDGHGGQGESGQDGSGQQQQDGEGEDDEQSNGDPSGSPGPEGQSNPDADTAGDPEDGQQEGNDPPPDAASTDDAQAQQAADEAQRQQMQRALEQQALEQQAAEGQEQDEEGGAVEAQSETPAERERRLGNEAWLRRVPDDPGGLLREKFRIEHARRRWQGGQ